jgi:hypothetical protein
MLSSILLSDLDSDGVFDAEGAAWMDENGRLKSTTTMVPNVLSSLGPYERPALIMNTKRCSSNTPVTLLVCEGLPDGSGGLSIWCSCFEQGQQDAGGGHIRMGDSRYLVVLSTKLGFGSVMGALPLPLPFERG